MRKKELHSCRGLGRFIPVMVCAALGFVSCTTWNAGFVEFDEYVDSHEYLTAATRLEEAGADDELYGDKDQVLRYLDTGVLYHVAGNARKSIELLTEAEYLIEENFTKSITDAAASFLLNDYQLEYFGEVYEDLYLNVLKAIDFMRLDDFDGAYVEIRRVGDKLNLLEDKYGELAGSMNASEEARGSVKAGKTEFHNSALARYISLLLYRADGRRDSAAIDLDQLKKAFAAQPNVYDFPLPPDLDRLIEATDMARVNVIGFAGLSPIKRAYTLRLTTANDLILITQEKEDADGNMVLTDITPIPFSGIDGGYNFKCQLAEMFPRPSRVARMRVVVDDVPAGDLALIEKLDRVAVETFKLKESMVLLKTVIRTVTKGIITQKAKSAASSAAENAGGGWLSVLSFVGGVAADIAVDATEEADLRGARYFPGQAYVGEFLIEPGRHELRVDYYDSAGGLLYQEKFPPIDYKPGELNLLSAYDLQ